MSSGRDSTASITSSACARRCLTVSLRPSCHQRFVIALVLFAFREVVLRRRGGGHVDLLVGTPRP